MGLIKPEMWKKKRALECIRAGDGTAPWVKQRRFPLPGDGEELGGLQGAALNS